MKSVIFSNIWKDLITCQQRADIGVPCPWQSLTSRGREPPDVGTWHRWSPAWRRRTPSKGREVGGWRGREEVAEILLLLMMLLLLMVKKYTFKMDNTSNNNWPLEAFLTSCKEERRCLNQGEWVLSPFLPPHHLIFGYYVLPGGPLKS